MLEMYLNDGVFGSTVGLDVTFERALSARSVCAHCRKPIPKGDFRAKFWLPQDSFSGEWSKRSSHVSCMRTMLKAKLNELDNLQDTNGTQEDTGGERADEAVPEAEASVRASSREEPGVHPKGAASQGICIDGLRSAIDAVTIEIPDNDGVQLHIREQVKVRAARRKT